MEYFFHKENWNILDTEKQSHLRVRLGVNLYDCHCRRYPILDWSWTWQLHLIQMGPDPIRLDPNGSDWSICWSNFDLIWSNLINLYLRLDQVWVVASPIYYPIRIWSDFMYIYCSNVDWFYKIWALYPLNLVKASRVKKW